MGGGSCRLRKTAHRCRLHLLTRWPCVWHKPAVKVLMLCSVAVLSAAFDSVLEVPAANQLMKAAADEGFALPLQHFPPLAVLAGTFKQPQGLAGVQGSSDLCCAGLQGGCLGNQAGSPPAGAGHSSWQQGCAATAA